MTGASEAERPQDGFRIEALGIFVRTKINPRARRLILRADPSSGGIVLVLPSAKDRRRGIAFAEANARWIAAHRDRTPVAIPLLDGAVVPVLGQPHRIRHSPGLRSIVAVESGEIQVGGRREDVASRVGKWLRIEARRILLAKSREAAGRIGAKPTSVTVRDTRSRWGSCSPAGRLSYSWRLLLAPEAVLDYVVIHEVAHLRELHHGPSFWRLVEQLCPDHRRLRRWLRENGASLHRYG